MRADTPFMKVLALLDSSGVRYAIHDYGAKRVDDVQGSLPFPVDHLVKTLAFRSGESWILVAILAQDRVDYRRLADTCGVARSAITAPSPQEVEATLGVEVGGVPPIRLNDRVRVLIDQGVLERETVFCGAGQPGKTLEISAQDLLDLCGGRVAAIAREKD